MYEHARAAKRSLWNVFVDLKKAYDSVDRGKLFTALVGELGLSPEVVRHLRDMYTSVRVRVLVRGEMGPEFEVKQGVLQGCPCSPLVFILFADRLEGYIRGKVGEWSQRARKACYLGGFLIPLLLFADDIVLSATDAEYAQRLVDVLEEWCGANSQVVNVGKTKWLALKGRKRYRELANRERVIQYGEADMEHVERFKYMGLEFSGSAIVRDMVHARMAEARKAWGKLVGSLTSLGWRDQATRLVLLDAYVRSVLTFGAPVWGMGVLQRQHDMVGTDAWRVDALYRRYLKQICGLPRELSTDVLHVLTCRFPARFAVGKAVWRYWDSLTAHPRAAGEVG